MLNIEDADKKVQQVDSLLTSITKLLKKHWLILIFISILAFGYWVWNLPEEEYIDDEYLEEEVYDDPIYAADEVDSVLYYEEQAYADSIDAANN